MSVTAGPSRFFVHPHLSRPLSASKLSDYMLLLRWFYYFPQALAFYTTRYAADPQGEHWRTLQRMALFITLAALAAVTLFSLLAFQSVNSSHPGLAPAHHYWLAGFVFAGLLLGLNCISLFIIVGYALPLLLMPTLATLLALLTFGYAHALRLPSAGLAYLVAMYVGLGAYMGLAYNQAIAYRNYGLHDVRILLTAGTPFSLLAALMALLIYPIMPMTEPLPGIVIYLILTFFAGYFGFLFVALRLDDWLFAWLRTSVAPPTVVYAPCVSLLPFSPLKRLLVQQTNFNDRLLLAADIWKFTLQHQLVARELYAELQAAPSSQQSEQLVLVTQRAMPWSRPAWLAQGGRRSVRLLLNNLFRTRSWDTLSVNVEHATVDTYLLTLQVCRDAESLKDAISRISRTASSADQLYIVDMLIAIDQLMAEKTVIGTVTLAEIGYSRKAAIEKAQGDMGWRIILKLEDIYPYAWLAHRCQDIHNREEAVRLVRRTIDEQQSYLDANQIVDASVRRFLRALLAKWKSDMQSIVDAQDMFQPLPFLFVGQASSQEDGAKTTDVLQSSNIGKGWEQDRRPPNPFEYDDPLRNCTQLVRRRSQISALREAWEGTHCEVVEITAPILCGSTSLFLAVADSYQAKNQYNHNAVNMAYISIGHLNTDATAVLKIANGLYDQLCRFVETPPSKDDLCREPMRTLELMIREICRNSDQVLLVGFDDIEHLERVIDQFEHLRRFMLFIFHLNELIPTFGIALIGTIDSADAYRLLRPQTTRFARPIRLGTIGGVNDGNDVVKLLNTPVPNFAPRYTPEAINLVLELTGGVPYLVQLIAWNVYEQFRQNYVPPNSIGRPQTRQFIHDPLFTRRTVEQVLDTNAFRHGVRYYIHRLCTHFGTEWDHAQQVLEYFRAGPGAQVTSYDFPPLSALSGLTAGGSAPVDQRRARELLERLRRQCVLDRLESGAYTLRVRLMAPDYQQSLAEDDDVT